MEGGKSKIKPTQPTTHAVSFYNDNNNIFNSI